MSLLDRVFGSAPTDTARQEAAAARQESWRVALEGDRLPQFVTERLADAGAARVPWLSTMTPAELLLARSHGIRPVATVSGTCWYHYGFSWTNGHAEGWRAALGRMRREAVAAGANAIVDVHLRTTRLRVGSSMDFTAVGTAVRMDSLPPSREPVIATVPAIEFVRLLEAGIVPTGVAVGGHYDWLTPTGWNPTARGSWSNAELIELSRFWDAVRRRAIDKLAEDTRAQRADGVLAHTHFAQLLKPEGGDENRPRFLGRHIVIGTTVHCRARDGFPHPIRTVIDMRDDESPLLTERPHGHNAYAHTDQEGSI